METAQVTGTCANLSDVDKVEPGYCAVRPWPAEGKLG